MRRKHRLKQTREREPRELIFRRREGIGLILALAIMVVGGVLAFVIFDISYLFFHTSLRQRVTYVDHTTVVDIIQRVKGFILETNSSDGVVIHPEGYDGPGVEIPDIRVIRFSDTPYPLLSADGIVSSSVGLQYYTVSVYDTNYLPDQLREPLRSSPELMRELPPPIHISGRIGSSTSMTDDSTATTPDIGLPSDSKQGSGLDWDKFGSYLIRVRLFHIDEYDHMKPARTAEEAFLQVLP